VIAAKNISQDHLQELGAQVTRLQIQRIPPFL
jgi:hypothetical protein